ncbi:FUSC family protein [Streptomyces griseocarneus]|uniref:FUSC family protein n=1 Tax=Streptomyces griseocarneus TaxID=51201 RepID=UPI00167EC93F|nr:FUSC family protein [Streptomyces griseocarneus]MBZ6474213.1 FUSC family protein [Streptomyces griseocarneus]
MTTALGRRLRRPDGRDAVRRALWVTLAGCTGFYACTYGLDDAVMGLYALFGCLPLVMFARLPGGAARRTRTLLAALPVALLLVTAGSLLAVRDWAAACGMLVVGFAVSYGSVGGPRLAALSVAFQLFYVLPCFPPYDPQVLDSRLAGLTIGFLLTVLVDHLLPQPPPAVPYRLRLAGATAAVAACCAGTADGPDADRAAADRTVADRALDAARPSRLPPEERPASPSARDRALNHTRAAVRHVRDQLERLPAGDGPHPRHPEAAGLLRRTAEALRPVAAGLCGGNPPPPADGLRRDLVSFDAVRVRDLPAASALRLRHDAVVRAAAEGAQLATTASRIALGARPGTGSARPGEPFWYAAAPAPLLWWRRLRAHLTPRSVHLQNAVRLALALAAARTIAGALDLSHGFWVLLATLSLMRTSAADTRTALRPAFAGTVGGAGAAALLLLAVGDVPPFYAAVLPLVLLVGFTAGPLLGPAWNQAAFTLAFVLMFSQLSSPDWRLSAVRLLDVLIGGAIGALASLLAWPRGGRGELRCTLADVLVEGAAGCRAVTGLLCGRPGPADPMRPARRTMILAEASYCQYQTERMGERGVDPPWEAALVAGYRMLRGGELMLIRYRERAGDEPLPEDAAAELTALAERVTGECLRAADALRRGDAAEDTTTDTTTDTATAPAVAAPDTYHAGDSGTLRCAARRAAVTDAGRVLLTVDAEAWLTGVAQDVARVRAPEHA